MRLGGPSPRAGQHTNKPPENPTDGLYVSLCFWIKVSSTPNLSMSRIRYPTSRRALAGCGLRPGRGREGNEAERRVSLKSSPTNAKASYAIEQLYAPKFLESPIRSQCCPFLSHAGWNLQF